jgi:hypothetical protein
MTTSLMTRSSTDPNHSVLALEPPKGVRTVMVDIIIIVVKKSDFTSMKSKSPNMEKVAARKF